MADIGDNGGPRLTDDDMRLAMMFARFNVNDILKTLLEMRSMEHRGFFMTALLVMYDRGGYLPADDIAASRALATDPRTYRRLKAIMIESRKIRLAAEGVTNDRVLREIDAFCRDQQRRRDAALKGVERRRQAASAEPELQINSGRSSADLRPIFARSPADLRPSLSATQEAFDGDLFEKPNEINECGAASAFAAPAQMVPLARAFPKPKQYIRGGEVESSPDGNTQIPPMSETAVSDVGRRQPTSTRKPAYPAAFEAAWKAWPGGGDKKPAFAVWERLDEEDRRKAVEAMPLFAEEFQQRRATQPDATPQHFERYLRNRRFETLLEAREGRKLVGPNGKPWGWWLGREDRLRDLGVERWRIAIDKARPNGTWPWWLLGPAPGATDCLIPQPLLDELGLVAKYRGQLRTAEGGRPC